MRNVEFDEAARAEFRDDALYFEQQREGSGQLFFNTIATAIDNLRRYPHLGRRSRYRTRTLNVSGFGGYRIVYRVGANLIYIYAIAHHSRRPNYWRKRLR